MKHGLRRIQPKLPSSSECILIPYGQGYPYGRIEGILYALQPILNPIEVDEDLHRRRLPDRMIGRERGEVPYIYILYTCYCIPVDKKGRRQPLMAISYVQDIPRWIGYIETIAGFEF